MLCFGQRNPNGQWDEAALLDASKSAGKPQKKTEQPRCGDAPAAEPKQRISPEPVLLSSPLDRSTPPPALQTPPDGGRRD